MTRPLRVESLEARCLLTAAPMLALGYDASVVGPLPPAFASDLGSSSACYLLAEGEAITTTSTLDTSRQLLFAAIANPVTSPTNPGLLTIIDLEQGLVVPWHATLLAEGISGLAFDLSGRLFATTDRGASQASELLELSPVNGQALGRLPITSSSQPIRIGDLAFDHTQGLLYGIRAAHGNAGGAGELYRIDPATGAATLVGNTGTGSSGGLAFTPTGQLYLTGVNGSGASVLYQIDPTTAAPLSQVVITDSTGQFQRLDGLAAHPDHGQLVGSDSTSGRIGTIHPQTGVITPDPLGRPVRGFFGDLDFQPQRRTLNVIYREDFELGGGGYIPDNTGGTLPGLWHYSAGRRFDHLPSHTPNNSWYYGAFETAFGQGNYVLPQDHEGRLHSPQITLPESGTTIVSFNYFLDTLPELHRDFVRVSVIDELGTLHPILSRQDGTLPVTAGRWRTATHELTEFNGQTIRLEFLFDTGDATPIDPEGWYVDDVWIVNVAGVADLAITKSVDDATPNELQQITYTLTASNGLNSSATATGVVVHDALPDGVTFISASPAAAFDAITGRWTVAHLPAGASESLTITVAVNVGTAGSILINNAVITGNELDPDPANNTASESVTVNSVDLSIQKEVDDTTPNELQQITYTLTAANSSQSNAIATGILVQEQLPAGVTFLTASPADAYDPISGTWTVPDLLPDGTATLTITVIVDAGTSGQTLENTATILGSETDPDPTNNQDSASVVVNRVDLSLTKQVDDPTPQELQQVTYTLTVTNSITSNAIATGVVVQESLPAGVVFLFAHPTSGYNPLTGLWNVPDLAIGDSASLAITVLIQPNTAGQILLNSAVVNGNETDPEPDDNQDVVRLTVSSVVQFITPLSLFRLAGPFADSAPNTTTPTTTAETGAIQGYKWHDVNQNGLWDAGEPVMPGWPIYLDLNGNNQIDLNEPVAVTATDGSYAFSELAPGTYTIREDRTFSSDGTFSVQRFPGIDPNRDPDEHLVSVVAGQVIEGGFQMTEAPNFGVFEYSPFVRPADELWGQILHASPTQRDSMLAAIAPWQGFAIKNTTGTDFQIERIDKLIDTSHIAAADAFVTIKLRSATGFEDVQFPLIVPAGTTVEFVAFYDPRVLSAEGQVLEQFPDWLGAARQSNPAHTFRQTDHLAIVTNTDVSFRVQLVGGSTYDSDIFYDGQVDFADLGRLNDLLLIGSPLRDGFSPHFDPTSDINARCHNGAETIVGTCAWPLGGAVPRELGLGDFAPLQVEFLRARAPFLDLDIDNSTTSGTGYVVELSEGAVHIVDADARFANRNTLELAELRVTLVNGVDGEQESLTVDLLDTNLVATWSTTGTQHTLLLSGSAAVEDYQRVLRTIQYSHTGPTPTPGMRVIEVQALGGTDFTLLDRNLDGNIDDAERSQIIGNVAIAIVHVLGPQPEVITETPSTPIAETDELVAEGEATNMPVMSLNAGNQSAEIVSTDSRPTSNPADRSLGGKSLGSASPTAASHSQVMSNVVPSAIPSRVAEWGVNFGLSPLPRKLEQSVSLRPTPLDTQPFAELVRPTAVAPTEGNAFRRDENFRELDVLFAELDFDELTLPGIE